MGLGVGEKAGLVGARGSLAADACLDGLLDELDRRWPGRSPVLIGGTAPAARLRVAVRGDGWNPRGLPPERLAPMFAEIRDLAAQHGRDPDRLTMVVRADVQIDATADRRPYAGSFDQVVADLLATREAGAHEVILGVSGDPTLDETLDCYARLAESLCD